MAKHKLVHKEKIMTGVSKHLDSLITVGSSVLPFFSQLTKKDIDAINTQLNGAELDFMDQMKNTVNIVSGRITGINPFKDAYQAPATRNIAGIFNSWTFMGIGLQVLGNVGKGFIPHSAKLKKYGRSMTISGAAGGFFDAPPGGQTGTIKKSSGIQLNRLQTPENMVSGGVVTFKQAGSSGYSGASLRLSQ